MQAKCTFLLLKKMFIFAVVAGLVLALAPAAQAEPVDYVDFVGDASTLLNLSGRDVREVLAAVNFWDPDRERAKDVGVIQGVDFDDFRNNVDDTGSPIPLMAGVPGATLATIIAQEPGREFGAGELGSVDGTQIGTFTPQNADNIEAEKLAQGGAYFQDKTGTTMTFSFGPSYANTTVEVQMLGGGMWDKGDNPGSSKGILTASVGGDDLGYVEDKGYNIQLSTFETTTDGNGDLLIDLTLTGDRYVILAGIIVMVPEPAHRPDPTYGATDVYRDTLLIWTPDEFSATHDLYIGDSFEDVNDATVPTHAGLDVNSFDPGRLEFGQTYYWRVDEVNGAPDNTVSKGNVWSFEVEPYSIQIQGDGIVASASSVQGTSGPENTINGSGLDPKTGTHNTTNADMWFSLPADMSPWLQYEFDDVKLLGKLLLWNSNSVAELAIGWGLKDVQIEYSVDGTEWTPLPGVAPLNRAPGLPTYDTPDEVPLGNVPAKFVKISMLSNQGGVLPAYSVSEVQFFEIPVKPRTPNPEDQAVDVMPDDATLTWRAGRETAEHIITISTDANALIDGSATSVTTSTNSLSLSDIGGELGQTYYWRVDEVNDAEVPSVWAGPMWTFSTQATLIVEDFEAYGNNSPNRPFQTWLDGFGYSADEFFPVTYPGNGTGSGIGHDIWSLASPY
ncbi:MAG: discoidin domain-containing protein, partial [Planctomycetes bacterium]|nr:discoidin domain-containing protein [Planctomycetota bacterium]